MAIMGKKIIYHIIYHIIEYLFKVIFLYILTLILLKTIKVIEINKKKRPIIIKSIHNFAFLTALNKSVSFRYLSSLSNPKSFFKCSSKTNL